MPESPNIPCVKGVKRRKQAENNKETETFSKMLDIIREDANKMDDDYFGLTVTAKLKTIDNRHVRMQAQGLRVLAKYTDAPLPPQMFGFLYQ